MILFKIRFFGYLSRYFFFRHCLMYLIYYITHLFRSNRPPTVTTTVPFRHSDAGPRECEKYVTPTRMKFSISRLAAFRRNVDGTHFLEICPHSQEQQLLLLHPTTWKCFHLGKSIFASNFDGAKFRSPPHLHKLGRGMRCHYVTILSPPVWRPNFAPGGLKLSSSSSLSSMYHPHNHTHYTHTHASTHEHLHPQPFRNDVSFSLHPQFLIKLYRNKSERNFVRCINKTLSMCFPF